jgi:hypothetical protein
MEMKSWFLGYLACKCVAIPHTETRELHEEWCLLGCYAVWLL